MGIIESLKTKKGRTAAIGVGLLVVAAIIIGIQLVPSKKYDLKSAFFSDDDGKTWYKDSLYNVPPYVHDGKTAVRAAIYSYAGGSKEFCAYLLEFGPSEKKAIDAASIGKPPEFASTLAYGMGYAPNIMVKKPLSNDPWVSQQSSASKAVVTVTAPDNSEVDSVLP